jgi:hypothetical protein
MTGASPLPGDVNIVVLFGVALQGGSDDNN